MYRRRGTSQAPAGVLILSVVNQGNDQDFLVTFSVPYTDLDFDVPSDLQIGGGSIEFVSQDDPDTLQVILFVPVAASGTWDLIGPGSTTKPLLWPQSGSY
jgi:hypothetical protein